MGQEGDNHRILRIILALAPAGMVALIVVFAYPSALTLPFIFDDPFDLPRAEAHSPWTILTSAPDYGYYRPFLYLLWKGLRALLGRYDPFWYHFLTVAAHVISGWLVFMLGRRLVNGASGLASAVLFVLYPFSYQVVPWAGALFHPFMTSLVLAAVLLYVEARRHRRPALLLPALLLAAVAMFTHEYGVMVAPLTLLWPLLRLSAEDDGRRLRYAVPFFLLSGAFLFVWWLVPKWSREPLGLDTESLRLSGLYFWQGFVYPVSRLAKPLAALSGWHPEFALAVLSSAATVTLALLYWWSGRLRTFLFAALWFTLAVLPAWAVLPFDYVIDAPRLLYLASVGAALAWGSLISLFSAHRVPGHLWRLAAALGLVVVGWQSWQFIAARNVLYDHGARLVREVMDTATAADDGTLYVNLPAWLALKEDEYALGHGGVVLIPDYVGLTAATSLHTGRSNEVQSARYEVVLQPWQYNFGPHDRSSSIDELDPLLRRVGVVYLTRFQPDGLRLAEAGRLKAGEAPPSARLADLGDSFALVNAEVKRESDTLSATLRWFARRADNVDHTVFLHLYDENGYLVAQNDGYPMLQLSPPRLWHAGDSVLDRRAIIIPPDLTPGRYRLVAGMYDRQSGQRLPARDAAGAQLPDGAVVIGFVALP